MDGQYNVLIVDDEKIIRDGIKHLLNSQAAGRFKVVAEASNGREALDICCNNPMDIVLTDIKMPVMDGIEFIHALKEKLPLVKVIILSNHAEFHYAREALSLGAVDYILKVVINYGELIKVLEKAGDAIEKEQYRNDKAEKIKNKIDAYAEQLKGEFLVDLATGAVKKEDIRNKIRFWEMRIGESNLICAVIEPFNKYILQSKHLGNSMRLLEDRAHSAIRNILTHYDAGEAAKTNGLEFIVLLSFEKEHSRYTIEKKIYSILSDIREALCSIFATEIAIGVSGTGTGFEGISELYLEASKALEFKFYHNPDRNIQYDSKACFTEIDYDWSAEKINDIVETVKRCDSYKCISLIEDVYKEVGKHKAFPQSVKRFSVDLIVNCVKMLRETRIPLKEEYFERYHEILSMDNIRSISSFVSDFIIKVIDCAQAFYSTKYRKEIWDAIYLINDRYSEDLPMSVIAEYVGMSTKYFCEIFKRETGENAVSYINRVRIEKAKELLSQSNMKVYEVAEKVGITAPRYFNKVFKKIVGVNARDVKSQKNLQSEAGKVGN